MKTDYKGIDYGLGQSNVDKDTGIRFGVLPQNALNPEASDCIWQDGRDLDYENYLAEAKDKLRSALSDYFSDWKHGLNNNQSKLDAVTDDAFDAISQELSDVYQADSPTMLLEVDGYKIQSDSGGDVWILKSPYYTHAQFCSPCAPGACYLTSPCDSGEKAYCLDATWFDDDKAPYPIYSVETGKLVSNG